MMPTPPHRARQGSARSPWAREYARTPQVYIWGTAPSAFARKVSALLPRGARVLELGCGEGRDCVFLASRGFDVTGIEISAAGLRKAARLARERGVEVRWVHGDMARPAVPGPFDLVEPVEGDGDVEVETHHRLHIGVDGLPIDDAVGDTVLGEEREEPIEEIGAVERHGFPEVPGAHVFRRLIGGVLPYHSR